MNKTTVLIVEDEAIVAADLAGKLEQLGYEVAGTAAGEEAVELACRLRPGIVLMDIRLKGPLDGIEAAEAIHRRIDVPVIYLTAHSDSATLARAKLTEPFGYILKPFEERELATNIEMALYKHQSDRRLRDQREWLRVTLTSIGDAVIACDTDARVTFLNPVAEELTGWKAEEAPGRPLSSVFRVVNEQTGQPLEEPVARVLREGRAVALANHAALVTKDGRTVPVEDSAAPILDAAGRVIGVVLVFHDVTGKRRTEANQALLTDILRVLNRGGELQPLIADTLRLIQGATGFDAVGLRLRQGEDYPYFEQNGFDGEFLQKENTLCAQGGDGAIVRDRSGRAVLECTCGVVLSGRTDPGMTCFTPGGSFWTNAASGLLALPSAADPRTNPRNRCIHAGYESVGLFPLHSGGEIIGLLQLNGRRAGRFTPDLIAFFEGVAQNIGLAVQRTITQQALGEREERLASMLGSITDAYVALDVEGRILEINPVAARQIFRRPAGELIGTVMWEAHPEWKETDFHRQCLLVQAEQRPVHFESHSTINDRWFEAHAYPHGGRCEIYLRDITDRKRAEQERERLIAELEAAIRELEGFSYSVSHDLRAPIRHIASFAHLLKKDAWPVLGERSRHFLDTILNASRRMGILADELLEFSRMGRTEMKESVVDLDILVREVISSCAEETKDRAIQWRTDRLPTVRGDSSMLHLAFMNLIANALKFTRGRSPASIDIEYGTADSEHIITVRDNGVGFDMRYVDKLFGVFQRLHTAEEFEGAGIGLANVQRIVQRHGGRVWAEGKVGEGAAFSIALHKEDGNG